MVCQYFYCWCLAISLRKILYDCITSDVRHVLELWTELEVKKTWLLSEISNRHLYIDKNSDLYQVVSLYKEEKKDEEQFSVHSSLYSSVPVYSLEQFTYGSELCSQYKLIFEQASAETCNDSYLIYNLSLFLNDYQLIFEEFLCELFVYCYLLCYTMNQMDQSENECNHSSVFILDLLNQSSEEEIIQSVQKQYQELKATFAHSNEYYQKQSELINEYIQKETSIQPAEYSPFMYVIPIVCPLVPHPPLNVHSSPLCIPYIRCYKLPFLDSLPYIMYMTA